MEIAKEIQLGFWKGVKERAAERGAPIVVLAPMADVTDVAFRQIIAKYSRMADVNSARGWGGPDVLWTEFVSADGLCSAGREVLLRDLAYTESERPIVAQLFTAHPEKMHEAATLAQKLGFDGLDINMGCPDRSIEKQCAGAAMIKDPARAKEVIRAAKAGAPNIPVSVKTRVGYNKVEIETWIPALLEENIAVLTIHCRTRKEMSDVPARWDLVKRVVEIRDEVQKDIAPENRTLILGNGDVKDLADVDEKCRTSGADGAMLGRAIFGNPWLFDSARESRHTTETTSPGFLSSEIIRERLIALVEHTHLFHKLLGDIKNFAVMKKHYKAYVGGWDGAKELRVKLMETNSPAEVETIVTEYLAGLK